jgi:hypothetical protein
VVSGEAVTSSASDIVQQSRRSNDLQIGSLGSREPLGRDQHA